MERRYRRIPVPGLGEVSFRGHSHPCEFRDASAEGLRLWIRDGSSCHRGTRAHIRLSASGLRIPVKVVWTRHGVKSGTEIGVVIDDSVEILRRQEFTAWLVSSMMVVRIGGKRSASRQPSAA